MALSIICDAVERYKELCEGAYAGTPICHMPCAFMLQPLLVLWRRWCRLLGNPSDTTGCSMCMIESLHCTPACKSAVPHVQQVPVP